TLPLLSCDSGTPRLSADRTDRTRKATSMRRPIAMAALAASAVLLLGTPGTSLSPPTTRAHPTPNHNRQSHARTTLPPTTPHRPPSHPGPPDGRAPGRRGHLPGVPEARRAVHFGILRHRPERDSRLHAVELGHGMPPHRVAQRLAMGQAARARRLGHVELPAVR